MVFAGRKPADPGTNRVRNSCLRSMHGNPLYQGGDAYSDHHIAKTQRGGVGHNGDFTTGRGHERRSKGQRAAINGHVRTAD